MSTANHTTGAWSVLDHHGVYVLADASLTVATVSHQLHIDEQMANARLLAAAPELLKALKVLRVSIPSKYGALREIADRAITKALGSTS